MKFLILLLISHSALAAASLPGTDDLRPLISASGTYTRSLATDFEDKNDDLCADIVRLDVEVKPALKQIAVTQSNMRYDSKNEPKGLVTDTSVVQLATLSTMSGINGVDVTEVTLLRGNAVWQFHHTDVTWLGVRGKWQPYQELFAALPGDKVRYGRCTFRRYRP